MAAIPLLQKHVIEELTIRNETFERKIENFKINPKINFSVTRKDAGKPFLAILELEIGSMDDESPIYIRLKLRGYLLAIKPQGDESEFDAVAFHRKAFPVMFDTARAILAGATQAGGMVPILLAPIDPNTLNINRG